MNNYTDNEIDDFINRNKKEIKSCKSNSNNLVISKKNIDTYNKNLTKAQRKWKQSKRKQ